MKAKDFANQYIDKAEIRVILEKSIKDELMEKAKIVGINNFSEIVRIALKYFLIEMDK